jgi:hypothetical protein
MCVFVLFTFSNKKLVYYNNNIIIQFFIISVLHQLPQGQLQMQHKGRQNNKYNEITTIRLWEITWLQRKLVKNTTSYWMHHYIWNNNSIKLSQFG